MSKAAIEPLLKNISCDEADRMPDEIHISRLKIILYIGAIVWHLVDIGLDINVAVQYYKEGEMGAFWWTLAFILIPAFINTAVSLRMYAHDKLHGDNTHSNAFTGWRWVWVFTLVLQIAPLLRFTDVLIYAVKSRRAEKSEDSELQRDYYGRMLKEDADAALLRVFESFLETAPQQVLQITLLLQHADRFAMYQSLSIASSLVSQGWCLGAYQRAIRFAQDKDNMSWPGTAMQTAYHCHITLSRIISISVIAFLAPPWALAACVAHILAMAALLQLFDPSPFCADNKLGDLAFSCALGAVYLFTYILPVEGNTRYRHSVYYSICFLENVACGVLWFIYANDSIQGSDLFYSLTALTVLPFLVGIGLLILYYLRCHPKLNVEHSHVVYSKGEGGNGVAS